MSFRSLGNPFDPESRLQHESGCACGACPSRDQIREPAPMDSRDSRDAPLSSSEDIIDRAVENTVVRAMFGQNDPSRRRFMKLVGGGTVAAALATFLPMDKIKAAIKQEGGPLEKTRLRIGFIPITCATPIIMAHPMGFYGRYGLDVEVIKTAGWAVIRDRALAGEFDAAHMLSPMPLSISMGVGSSQRSIMMPAVENINGQAITLHNDHKDKRDPKDWKGFRFAVPFEFSMHNFLLRYYVAEHGLDPDQDIQIRVLPPPEMVANLRAGNVDGYLAPDPFNQRAVWDRIGFIHTLTKDIWPGHPCCAFAASQEWIQEHPNTFGALFRAIVDATHYSSAAGNRAEIAEAIAPRAYLNQPVEVLNQVLTGRFADGLGNIVDEPDRIDFDPFPWHSMAVWIMSQMKRWGYVEQDFDYRQLAEQVFLATECGNVMRELGYEPPGSSYRNHTIMGKEFDPSEPDAYIDSFEIRRT